MYAERNGRVSITSPGYDVGSNPTNAKDSGIYRENMLKYSLRVWG